MNKATINTNMIILARESRGWNQKEFATLIKEQASNLSRMESNEIGVSADAFTRIAKITHYPKSFFYQEGEILPFNLSFRKQHKIPLKVIHSITAQINIVRLHVQHLSYLLDYSLYKQSTSEFYEKFTSPIQMAHSIRALWKIDKPIIENLVGILEMKGIPIYPIDFGNKQIEVCSVLTKERNPILFYQKSLLGDRQKFLLAQELGHLLLHIEVKTAINKNIRMEATEFATELLMPEQEIRKDFESGNITISLLATLKYKWKISMMDLLHRADELGYLSYNQKLYLLHNFSAMKIKDREPTELDVAKENPNLIQQLIETLRENTATISLEETAKYLHITSSELQRMYFK